MPNIIIRLSERKKRERTYTVEFYDDIIASIISKCLLPNIIMRLTETQKSTYGVGFFDDLMCQIKPKSTYVRYSYEII